MNIDRNNFPQPPSLIGLATQSGVDSVAGVGGGVAPYNPLYEDPDDNIKKKRASQVHDKGIGALIRIILLSTVFFIILSQPVLYKITHKAAQYLLSVPFEIMGNEGCPTTKGILLHAAIFFVIMLFVLF